MSKTFLRSTFLAVIALLLSTASSAATIKLVDVDHALPRDGVYAGLYTLNIDGQNELAMCDDFNTAIYIGLQWTATPYGYSQIVGSAPVKFASAGVFEIQRDRLSVQSRADLKRIPAGGYQSGGMEDHDAHSGTVPDWRRAILLQQRHQRRVQHIRLHEVHESLDTKPAEREPGISQRTADRNPAQ